MDVVDVVGDLVKFEATVLDYGVDGGGAGVEAVLDQLHGGASRRITSPVAIRFSTDTSSSVLEMTTW
ncbi:hypothetical protein RHSIM_Rhsim02G0220100 [Rhododendron simsii]|uniref:Uncharacterized protein n=1 Tax=Rhododendron simsii TaxID=118357 RepID=A0A834HBK8_RHOSS|nr:hypothetical protein RHSIM_Rhsim02G0220100 [Rhododendron simsii]